jgi:hypothetical protein
MASERYKNNYVRRDIESPEKQAGPDILNPKCTFTLSIQLQICSALKSIIFKALIAAIARSNPLEPWASLCLYSEFVLPYLRRLIAVQGAQLARNKGHWAIAG